MDWIKKSIMATKGVGKNASGKTHNLTEKVQGNYHYTMGPYSKPVMHIKPGDTVVVETRDAFEGKIQKETDKPTQKLEMPFLNPQNGPIMIEGGAWDNIKQHMTPFYKATLADIPCGRMGKAEEIADQIVFLASQKGAFTTGTNIVIDGGLTKRIQF